GRLLDHGAQAVDEGVGGGDAVVGQIVDDGLELEPGRHLSHLQRHDGMVLVGDGRHGIVGGVHTRHRATSSSSPRTVRAARGQIRTPVPTFGRAATYTGRAYW